MTKPVLLSRLVLGFAIAVAATWLALNRGRLDPELIESMIRSLGLWGPFGHVLLFTLGTILFVPGALFGLAGGLLFGPILGTILNLAGATLGATAAFLIARYVAGDWIRQRAGGRLARLVSGVEAEGWRFVALTRLVPLVPFNLLNYALGLTGIRLFPYVLTSFVCMVPGTLAYTWLGHAGGSALAGNDAAIRYGMIGFAVLAAVAFLPGLVRRLRGEEKLRWIEVNELAARLDSKDIAVIDVRGPEEFSGPLSHIRDARNIPLAELSGHLSEIASLRDKSVILVCHTDKRSSNAAAFLGQAGFSDVLVLRGGMVRWNEAGLPAVDRS
jgi:uncharacterized membrane protein YdjX (TVP38/TMEM64 family)/rhodanese-related sulfurtransferase